MMEFWTSIPLMVLAALVAGVALVVASVSEQRRPEVVAVVTTPPPTPGPAPPGPSTR